MWHWSIHKHLIWVHLHVDPWAVSRKSVPKPVGSVFLLLHRADETQPGSVEQLSTVVILGFQFGLMSLSVKVIHLVISLASWLWNHLLQRQDRESIISREKTKKYKGRIAKENWSNDYNIFMKKNKNNRSNRDRSSDLDLQSNALPLSYAPWAGTRGEICTTSICKAGGMPMKRYNINIYRV